jgi:hypothetical protein
VQRAAGLPRDGFTDLEVISKVVPKIWALTNSAMIQLSVEEWREMNVDQSRTGCARLMGIDFAGLSESA